jgi:hypothetical protein
MMTQLRDVQQGRHGMGAVIASTAFTLAFVAVAAIWQMRPGGQATPTVAPVAVSGVSEGQAPRGGLAERYSAEQIAARPQREASESMMGGLAELYRDQALASALAAEDAEHGSEWP